MVLDSSGAGYLCAVGSCALSGSWQAAVKADAIQRHQLHPALLNLEMMFGVFLGSLVALADGSFTFTSWGILSALLFEGSLVFNLSLSFPTLGIAVGSGLASSVAVVTSLIWSAGILDQSMRSVGVTALGCVLVVLGLNLLVYTGRTFNVAENTAERARQLAEQRQKKVDGGGTADDTTQLLPNGDGSAAEAGAPAPEEDDSPRFYRGVAAALTAGVFGGSYLVPNESCCADDGTSFLLSLGLSALVVALPCSGVCALLVAPSPERPLLPTVEVLRDTAPWGIMGGVVCSVAIFLIIKAIDDIDYVVANTLTQCSVFVTGLWGWLLYRELQGSSAVAAFFGSASVMVLGASLVGYYGTE